MKHDEVSIIIPAFNEAQAIRATLTELLSISEPNQWEIIVVNDGSTDDTERILNQFANKISMVSHPYNKGYGASLKSGIQQAKGEIVVLFDADGQHNPNDIPKLLAKLSRYDLVIGERTKLSENDWIRKPGKFLLRHLANILVGRTIPDFNCGLRAVRKQTISGMFDLFSDGFSFSTTSTIAFYKMNYNIAYVPIVMRKRTGTSTVRQLKHGGEVIMLMLRLIMLFSPLKIFLTVSAVFLLIGLVYQIISMIQIGMHIVNGALLLILTGILVFLFGLIADQISSVRLTLRRTNNHRQTDTDHEKTI